MSENFLSGINKTKTIKDIVKTPEWSKVKYPAFRESPEFKRNNTGYAGLKFDGSDDYVTIPDSTSLDTAFGSKNFTLEAWVYPNDWVNYRGIINKRSSGYYSASPGGLFCDTDGIRAVIGTGNDAETSNSVSYKPSLNEWHHVVGTADGSTLKLYVDGSLRGSAAITVNPPPNNDPLTIGSFFSDHRSFNGTIDEVRIFNRALSASEVQQLYAGGFVDLTGLVLWHDYKSGSAKDLSGNNNNGVLNNGPIYV